MVHLPYGIVGEVSISCVCSCVCVCVCVCVCAANDSVCVCSGLERLKKLFWGWLQACYATPHYCYWVSASDVIALRD
jgi:hypothetical protein